VNSFSFKLAISIWALALTTGLRADDWPHFLGPKLDFHSEETGLDLNFPEEGPKILWEIERGKGHSGPVISDGHVVFIHQLENNEEVRCVKSEDGSTVWKHSYPVDVAQSYGITDTPRSSPVIDVETGQVFTLGNDGDLIAFDLKSGTIKWQLKLPEQFGPSPLFFGYGGSPLLYQDKLIINVGAEGACVVAFDKHSGEVKWKTAHEWNGSYSSPVVGQVNGEDRVYVFAGGMTKPPHGGLICLNPVDGKIDDSLPWRSTNFASVNAASPVPCGPNRVFITEDYGKGGALVQFDANFKANVLWTSAEFGCQFQTPIYHEGLLFGLGGNGGLMMGFDVYTGRMLWNEAFYQTTIPWKGRDIPISLGHAHIIHVDGAFLCLSENGSLLRMDLGAGGFEILAKARLFYAPETWAPPAISDGKLFINQNEMGSRLICYDISGK